MHFSAVRIFSDHTCTPTKQRSKSVLARSPAERHEPACPQPFFSSPLSLSLSLSLCPWPCPYRSGERRFGSLIEFGDHYTLLVHRALLSITTVCHDDAVSAVANRVDHCDCVYAYVSFCLGVVTRERHACMQAVVCQQQRFGCCT